MNASELPAAWPVDGPWTLRDVRSSNNLSYVVETPNEQYLLRIYQNTADSRRIRYEHALLTRLQHAGLSFAVPVPIAARSGETLVPLSGPAGEAVAALFQVIPGRQLDEDDLALYPACGSALAELDRALASIDIQTMEDVRPPLVDLHRWHPSVPDPGEALEMLPLPEVRRALLSRVLRDLLEAIPPLYARLPQQIVHGDFDGSNVLIRDGRVSGILDFEFAGLDLRALDPAIALCQFSGGAWGAEVGHRRILAFWTGYRGRLSLGRKEIEALPDLIRLYRMVSLIHREGRRRLGQAREEAVLTRADMLLRLEDWLSEHREYLVRQLMD